MKARIIHLTKPTPKAKPNITTFMILAFIVCFVMIVCNKPATAQATIGTSDNLKPDTSTVLLLLSHKSRSFAWTETGFMVSSPTQSTYFLDSKKKRMDTMVIWDAKYLKSENMTTTSANKGGYGTNQERNLTGRDYFLIVSTAGILGMLVFATTLIFFSR